MVKLVEMSGSIRTPDVHEGPEPDDLKNIGVTEWLDCDPRPTFVLDLDPDFDAIAEKATLTPTFYNLSLRSYDRLLDVVIGREDVESLGVADKTSWGEDKKPWSEFRTWVMSITKFDDSMDLYPLTFTYGGMLWTGSTVRRRWRIISGTCCYHNNDCTPNVSPRNIVSFDSLEIPNALSKNTYTASLGRVTNRSADLATHRVVPVTSGKPQVDGAKEEAESSTIISTDYTSQASGYNESSWSSIGPASIRSVHLSNSVVGLPDWTAKEPAGDLTTHLQFARSVDWSATALGPMSKWTPEFRQVTNLLMTNPHPAALFWGEELTMLYNEPYATQVAGRKHPTLMGTGFQGPFKELWATVGEIFAECGRTGKAVAMSNQMLPIERHGFLEETYFTWSFTPLYGGGPNILGFYNAPFETTLQQISSRWMDTLRCVGEETALATSVKEFWKLVLQALNENTWDVPFAVLYSVVDSNEDGDGSTDVSSTSSCGTQISSKSCVFEGSLGVPEGHVAVPPRLDLKRSREGFIPAFREAMRTREPTKIETRNGTLADALLEDFQWRGFGEPCREAVICPIRPTTDENVMGFLVIGVNPRRPYDSDYKTFIDMLGRQLATSLASVMLFEEEISKGHVAAKLAALEKRKLSEQLALQESRLKRMTELAPVGMFYIDSESRLLEANDRWYLMTGITRRKDEPRAWMEVFLEEDLAIVKDSWHTLTSDGLPWSGELRLKETMYDLISGEEIDNWVLFLAHPEFDAHGSVHSVMGSITNISSQKRSAEHALARARLSEELAIRTQQAAESQKNFKNFSDLAPGGLVILDPQGQMTYANDQWFHLTGHSRDASRTSWPSIIHEDSMDSFTAKWTALLSDHVTITAEIRVKKPWVTTSNGNVLTRETWILVSAYPEVTADNILLSIMACRSTC
jgi:PAS domain S-box-containing protein